MQVKQQTIDGTNVFVIKPYMGKAGLWELQDDDFPWDKYEKKGTLNGAYIYLRDGVFIDGRRDVDALFEILSYPVILVVENCNTVGAEAIYNIIDNDKQEIPLKARFYLGSMEIGGYSGMDRTSQIGQWAYRYKMSEEEQNKWEQIKKDIQ